MSRNPSWLCTHDPYAGGFGGREDRGCSRSEYADIHGMHWSNIPKGGYNIESISNSALAVVKVLLGEAPDELPPLIASEAGTETVYFTALEQSKYWKSVDPKTCEPRNGNVAIHLVASVFLYSARSGRCFFFNPW